MGLVAFAVIGLLIGIVFRALMPQDDPGGVLFTMVIGLAGGFGGGVFVSLVVGMDPIEQFFDVLTWAGAVGGAVVLLLAYKLISGTK